MLATLLGLAVWTTPAGAVQFRLLGWTAADTNLQFESNRQATETSVFTNDLSPLYEFKGDGPLVLYKMVEHDGIPRKQTACTIVIPAGATQGVIILMPGDNSQAANHKVLPDRFGFVSATAPLIYDYIWLDDSLEARPEGTIEFRNMSRLPVAMQIEGHQLLLTPQAKAQVPLAAGAKRMAFKAAAQLGELWKVFTSNPLPTRGPSRMMVIFRDGPAFAPSGGTDLQMMALYDWPPPPPGAPPAASAPSLASAR